MNTVFVETLVIALMGLLAMLGAAFLSRVDGVDGGIVMMLATAGSGLVGGAIGRWTGKATTNGNGKNGNGHPPAEEVLK